MRAVLKREFLALALVSGSAALAICEGFARRFAYCDLICMVRYAFDDQERERICTLRG